VVVRVGVKGLAGTAGAHSLVLNGTMAIPDLSLLAGAAGVPASHLGILPAGSRA
jgi:hypothetical protein